MAELPEIIILARQMDDHLVGRVLTDFSLGQPKCLNAPAEEYETGLIGRELGRVRPLGKWLVLEFDGDGPRLLINPGMGMDLVRLGRPLEKDPQFKFLFSDTGFTVRFWWFGYVRLAQPGQERAVAGNLGPAPLSDEFTPECLAELIAARPNRGLKAMLMDQKTLAGIGNVYAQDICFRIRAHPKTKLGRLSREQRQGLHAAIEDTLRAAIDLGISDFELDYNGRRGTWGKEALLVGYRTGLPCPECGTAVEKIKTGSTHHYICPRCQPER